MTVPVTDAKPHGFSWLNTKRLSAEMDIYRELTAQHEVGHPRLSAGIPIGVLPDPARQWDPMSGARRMPIAKSDCERVMQERVAYRPAEGGESGGGGEVGSARA